MRKEGRTFYLLHSIVFRSLLFGQRKISGNAAPRIQERRDRTASLQSSLARSAIPRRKWDRCLVRFSPTALFHVSSTNTGHAQRSALAQLNDKDQREWLPVSTFGEASTWSARTTWQYDGITMRKGGNSPCIEHFIRTKYCYRSYLTRHLRRRMTLHPPYMVDRCSKRQFVHVSRNDRRLRQYVTVLSSYGTLSSLHTNIIDNCSSRRFICNNLNRI